MGTMNDGAAIKAAAAAAKELATAETLAKAAATVI